MEHAEGTSRFPVFLSALRGAIGRTPIWLVCWLVPLIFALAVALPWVQWFGDATANRYAPGSVLAALDEPFRHDHREELAGLRSQSAYVTAVLALVVMLFGVFSAGGWLQVFLERTSGHSVRRFLWGASRYFWRFARLWILTILVLSVVAWLTYAWPWKTFVAGFLFGAPDGEMEVLTSERTAIWLEWLQSGIYTAAFALVLVWGDYTRTRMAMHDTRSAIWAGLATLGLMIRYPLRSVRPMVLLLAVEWLILWLTGILSWSVNTGLADGGGWKQVLLLFLVGQFALMWRAITRGARYHAAVQVSRALVPPLAKPDPWAHRVGGPGGPQYPIDQSDEYGVSL